MPLSTPFPMERDRKTVTLIANLLDQPQNRRTAIEDDRFILLSRDADDFFTFGDACQRLIHNIQRIESRLRRVQLSDAAINQNEVGHRELFFLDAVVASADNLAHALEIVRQAGHGPDDELPVIRLLHPAVLPYDHRCHNIAALEIGYVEAFYAARRLF